MSDEGLSLEAETEYVKLLYYGVGGTGKTTNAAGLARLGRTIHIDAEAGLKGKALRRMGIPIENIKPFRDIQYDSLEEKLWAIKGELEDSPDRPAGVVWDSVTEIQKKLLEFIARSAYNKTLAKAQRSGQESDRTEWDVYKEDWGVNTEQMRRLVRAYRDLDCHVAFTALPRRDQDNDGIVTYGPAVTPALQTDLIGYVDVGCACRVRIVAGEEEFYGVFHPVGTWWAKDRFHALPVELVDPSFDRVIAYINEELTVDTDPVMQESKERHEAQEARDGARRAEAAKKQGASTATAPRKGDLGPIKAAAPPRKGLPQPKKAVVK